MEQILIVYGLSKSNFHHYNVAMEKLESDSSSPDSDNDFFDIVAGVMQEDTLAP